MGPAGSVTALTACENVLFATEGSDVLQVRDPVGQNLPWTPVGRAPGVRALASPREAMGQRPVGLYAVTTDERLWHRPPVPADAEWTPLGAAPGVIALAASYEGLFGATASGELLHLRFDDIGPGARWTWVGPAEGVIAMTNLNSRLYGVTRHRRLWTRSPLLHAVGWTPIAAAPTDVTALAGHAGKLWISTADDRLWWRDAVPRARS